MAMRNMLQQKTTVKALIATGVVVFGAAAYHGLSTADSTLLYASSRGVDIKALLDRANQIMRSVEALDKYYPTRQPAKDLSSDEEHP